MNNKVGYKGKVTIKTSNKPVVVTYNAGTMNLFNNICNMLSLVGYSPDLSPTSIDFVTHVKNQSYVPRDSILINPLPITSKVVTDNKLELSTVLVKSQISSVSLNNNGYGILLDGKKRVLAIVENINFSELAGLSSSSRVTVDWVLEFNNNDAEG